MGIELQALRQIRQKFATHVASEKGERFELAPEDSRQLSELMRELGSRGQLGELTESESLALKEGDAFAGEIAKFNAFIKNGGENPNTHMVEKIYNPEKGELAAAAELTPPAPVPKISQAQADRIITDLNEQFVDKVLKKLRARAEVSAANPWEVGDFAVPAAPQSPGESLSNYLSRIRSELPDRPFGDADSTKDLSLLRQNHGVRQKN